MQFANSWICRRPLRLAGSALAGRGARAENSSDPTFGSRTEKPDGSVALTIGRRLPTDWDTKFGMDAKLSPEQPSAMADTVSVNPSVTRSTGAVWGSMSGPGVAPVIFDKTTRRRAVRSELRRKARSPQRSAAQFR